MSSQPEPERPTRIHSGVDPKDPEPISYLFRRLHGWIGVTYPLTTPGKAASRMQQNITLVYGLWGGLVFLLVSQALWSLFFGYPAIYERMLRRGRVWVYVPLRWKGFRKLQILFLSRLLVLGITASGTLLFVHYSDRRHGLWIAAFLVLCYAVAAWLQGFWGGVRYRQQEDAYYLLHDELRLKLQGDNKDYSEAQLRSLSTYQHQQRLRKADEEGKFLALVRDEARRFRLARSAVSPQVDIVEA